jgi:RHS repeat-associated protein
MISSAGVTQSTLTYEPYGALRYGTPTNEMQFTSDPVNGAASNLYDSAIRAYDTTTGRFLTQDPAGNPVQTAGTYAYGNDNPASYTDSSGATASKATSGLKCFRASSTRYGKALGGYTVTQIWNHTHWCVRSGKIVAVDTNVTPNVWVLPFSDWAYSNVHPAGDELGWKWYRKPKIQKSAVTADFCLQIPWGCAQGYNLEADLYVSGYGTFYNPQADPPKFYWQPGHPD